MQVFSCPTISVLSVFGLILCPLCLLCCENVFYSLFELHCPKPKRWNLIWACLICRRLILRLHSVFYSLLELWGGGGVEGGIGRHTCFSTAAAVILNWILCEQNWSLASEKLSAHYNTKEMAYLCLTCRYCCDFDWQYLCVGHTYAWHLILCEMWKREEHLFQQHQQLFVWCHMIILCKNITFFDVFFCCIM